MAKRKRIPEENARREAIRELLQMSNVESMEDVQNLFKETIATFMEAGLESELDDELGYDRYDYKNKQTDNSRNGHSQKTLSRRITAVTAIVRRRCAPASATWKWISPETGRVNLTRSC